MDISEQKDKEKILEYQATHDNLTGLPNRLLLTDRIERAITKTESDVYYTCSMDPQVVEQKPGKCPICKMDLTPVKKSNGTKKDEIQLSEQQIQLGNIQTDTIRTGTIGDRLVLTASLNFDQMKTSSVSSRVMGRIEKLYLVTMMMSLTSKRSLMKIKMMSLMSIPMLRLMSKM